MILAGAMMFGGAVSTQAQGLEDDFAQDWIQLESDESAIDLVGCETACDGCDAGCDGCCEPVCCPPWWAHRTGVSGQFLFLRPGDSDITYTIEQNNVNGFPTGPTGIAQIEHSPGVRVGFSHCASACTSLVGRLTYWQGDDSDLINASAGNVLVSEILHPSRFTTGATGLQEAAAYDMRYGTIDLAYRSIWRNTDTYAINWRGGFQYGGMEQEFLFTQTVPSSVANGTFSVDTDIDFTGFGLLGGLDFERYSCRTGLSCYGSAIASALAGKWKASYRDAASVAVGNVGNVYDDHRVTPVLELELGLAWYNKCGNIRLNCGYMNTAFYNAVSSRAYIDSVREGRFVDVDETITFSGLVAGGEFRW